MRKVFVLKKNIKETSLIRLSPLAIVAVSVVVVVAGVFRGKKKEKKKQSNCRSTDADLSMANLLPALSSIVSYFFFPFTRPLSICQGRNHRTGVASVQASPFFDMGGARTIILPFFLKKKKYLYNTEPERITSGCYRVLPSFTGFFFFCLRLVPASNDRATQTMARVQNRRKRAL